MKHSIQAITEVAGRLSYVSVKDLIGYGRFRHINRVRQAVFYVSTQEGHSSPQIAIAMGGRDHSTILHGARVAAEWAERNPDYALFLERIREKLGTPRGLAPLPAAQVARFVPPKPKRVRKLKPKNNFAVRAEKDPYGSFHAMVSRGSKLLAEAIAQARAA